MDVDPIRTELRRKHSEDRLGRGATCTLCAESALEALVQAPVTLIEQHHALGQNHEPGILIPICRNCHAKLHEQYAQGGVDLRAQPTFMERLLQMLRALAAFFRALGEALASWAQRVEGLIHQLDAGWPEWRTLSP